MSVVHVFTTQQSTWPGHHLVPCVAETQQSTWPRHHLVPCVAETQQSTWPGHHLVPCVAETQQSTWPGHHLVPCVAELAGSCITIHVYQALNDPKCLFNRSGLLVFMQNIFLDEADTGFCKKSHTLQSEALFSYHARMPCCDIYFAHKTNKTEQPSTCHLMFCQWNQIWVHLGWG